MGKSKKYKIHFAQQHPVCCFCGGTTPIAEIDHIPSRACFDGNMWPEGFDFPACSRCNRDTSQQEQVVAFFSRTLTHPGFPARKDEVIKLGLGSRNNLPGPMLEMESTYRRISDEIGVFEAGPETSAAFDVVLSKWAKAFYYLETGKILPNSAKILTRVITPHTLQTIKVSPGMFEGQERKLVRNGKDLSGQFGYLFNAQPDDDLFMFTVMFRRAFAAVLFVDVSGRNYDALIYSEPPSLPSA